MIVSIWLLLLKVSYGYMPLAIAFLLLLGSFLTQVSCDRSLRVSILKVYWKSMLDFVNSYHEQTIARPGKTVDFRTSSISLDALRFQSWVTLISCAEIGCNSRIDHCSDTVPGLGRASRYTFHPFERWKPRRSVLLRHSGFEIMITSQHTDLEVVFQRVARVLKARKICQFKLTMGTYRPFVLRSISVMNWLGISERLGFGNVQRALKLRRCSKNLWSRAREWCCSCPKVRDHLYPRRAQDPVSALSIVHTNKMRDFYPWYGRCRIAGWLVDIKVG